MSKWDTFFPILQKEHPTEEEKSRAQTVADEAVECHHNLVGNKIPKTHVAQYHSVLQYIRLHPGLLRKLIKHWVEQSYQTRHNIEQQFRHIPVTKRKSNCKAGKLESNTCQIIPSFKVKLSTSGKRRPLVPMVHIRKEINTQLLLHPPRQETQGVAQQSSFT